MTTRQIQNELDASRAAKEQHREALLKSQQRGYFSKTSFGRQFVAKFVEPFADALVTATEKPARGKATAKNIAVCWQDVQDIFNYIPPLNVADVSLKSILDCFGVCEFDKPRTFEAAKKIGRTIEDELRVTYYNRKAPDYVVSAQHKQLNTPGSNPHFKRYGAKQVVEKLLIAEGWTHDDLFPAWSIELISRIGLFILEVAKNQGLLTIKRSFVSRNNSPNFLDLADEIKAQILIFQNHLEGRSFKDWALLDLPRDWEFVQAPSRLNCTGGYYQQWLRNQRPLCRKYIYDSVFGQDAISLLNTMQRTAWNIDPDVLETATECLEKGIPIASFGAVVDNPCLKQGMPEDIAALPKDAPKRKEWNKDRAALHEAHAEALKKSIRSRNAIALAKKFQTEPRFYLSWSCDYRGRMYSQQPLLQPQASDYEKALLTFADGCKLDNRGEYWAAQAVGSARLGSTLPHQDRVNWTYENKELLKAIAEDPIRMTAHWENQADTPWQFLQLALEWNRVVLTRDKPFWDVPIGVDSTSSGLQLLSAFRRDQKGMRYANLFPVERHDSAPLDAYLEVLRAARERLEKADETKWLIPYLTYRKLGKAILMTRIYNSSLLTNRKDIKKFYRKEGLYPGTLDEQAINTITDALRDACREVFPAAFESLDWLQKLFNVWSKNQSHQNFKWTTPNNDVIHLIAYQPEKKVITCHHFPDTTIWVGNSEKVALKKMKNAFAPAVVHCYDACLLKSSFKDWREPISLIHDCLKVLPNDMDRALERVKRGFIHVCSGDPLARLADDLGVTERQLPRLDQGSGNLLSVLDSSYMFN